MNKIGKLIMLCAMVGFLYVLMMLLQPATNTMVETANTSANWSAHSSFEYAQAVMIGWPFWAYLVPVGIGIPAAVAILKGE